jgi:hypothetical protein
MTQSPYQLAITQTEELLNHYGFELMGFTAQELLTEWVKKYPALWVRLAVVEALYQGRYKAVSVEQILNFWLRKGDPNFHFNHEFERLICRKLPRYLTSFAFSSSSRSENHESLYLLTSLVSNPDNESDITNQNISILNATTQEFMAEKKQLVLLSEQFNPSPIDKFKPPSDDSNLYVKLKEVAFKK